MTIVILGLGKYKVGGNGVKGEGPLPHTQRWSRRPGRPACDPRGKPPCDKVTHPAWWAW